VSKTSLLKPEVRNFVEFYIDSAPALSAEVGYVPLPTASYEESKIALTGF
jgi:phosphate transport system substrate-binding protein